MKRMVLLFLTTVLILSASSFAEAQGTPEGFEYRIEKDLTATIIGYYGSDTVLNIPSQIDGNPVKSIGSAAFYDNDDIISVIVPEGVVSIGDAAFQLCLKMANISLPSTLNSIGEQCFQHCIELSSIIIPDNVTVLNDSTFYDCSKLTDIQLHDNITTLGPQSFVGVPIESFIFPKNLVSIGSFAFAGTKIKNIVIPDHVKVLEMNAIDSLPEVVSIVLPSSISKMNAYLVSGCPKLETISIPKSVKSIHNTNLEYCYKVSILGIKGSAAQAFAKKKGLPFVEVNPTQEVSIYLNNENITKSILSLDLNSRNTYHLNAQTYPENPWPGVTWKSSNEKTVSIDRYGILTILKKGKATITATAADGSGKKATFNVTVAHLVHEIKLDGENSIRAGSKVKLITEVLPEVSDNKKLDWKTSDKSVAIVDSSGTVTAKRVSENQQVTITATAKDGSGISTEFIITVTP